jgi:hypothetical protein
VRTERWKYSVRCPEISEYGNPVSKPDSDIYEDDFLYDLEADPWEQCNLIGIPAFSHVVTDMRRRLVTRMTAIGEKEPQFIDAPEKRIGQRQPTHQGKSTTA